MPIIKNGNGSTQLSVTVQTSIDNENSPSSNNEKVRPGLIDQFGDGCLNAERITKFIKNTSGEKPFIFIRKAGLDKLWESYIEPFYPL